MKNDFNSLYERFDELYTTYDDRKALKGYIESMSRKSSKEEVSYLLIIYQIRYLLLKSLRRYFQL